MTFSNWGESDPPDSTDDSVPLVPLLPSLSEASPSDDRARSVSSRRRGREVVDRRAVDRLRREVALDPAR